MRFAPARRPRSAALASGLLLGLTLLGCAQRRPVPRGGQTGTVDRRSSPMLASDATKIYEQMGLFAAGDPFPFVGSIAYLAGTTPDTTVVLVTLSIPTRALTFAREGDRYRGQYAVRLDVKQGMNVVRHTESEPVVRVRTFRETTRGDESILFQQYFAVPPGQYVLAANLRDVGSAKASTGESLLAVPRLGAGSISSPVVVYEATPRLTTDSMPSLVASPRATVTFGRDSVVDVYLEGYGAGDSLAVAAEARGERDAVVWRDTLSLPKRGVVFSGLLAVPLSRLGVGITALHLRRLDTGDSSRTPVFISFGDDLPVASFDQMLDYLRYFASQERLRALANSPPEQRATAWAAFLRETDPFPATPPHEALTDYFNRLTQATARFREENQPGWLTDRGMVYVTLGDPDQVYDQGGTDVSQRGRAQIWEYREHSLQLTFVDQSGFGRWRLTSGSENEFQLVARRIQSRR
jgi:GWxTD domain-containing protein